MKAVITGGFGFLGWHLAARLHATTDVEVVRLGRTEFASPEVVREAIGEADVIFHVAGVNRADTEAEVEQGNVSLARALADAIEANARPVRVVYANSIQADLDNPYGRGKAAGAAVLAAAVTATGGSLANVLLPNLFGEHGRGRYNSFVATFCSMLVDGGEPSVVEDRNVPLLHAQRAAQILMDAAAGSDGLDLRPEGHLRSVSTVLSQLKAYRALYLGGEIPDVSTEFDLDLFNTYRSYTFPTGALIKPEVHSDPRGDLFETLRSHGGTGQAYASTTAVGKTRGEHYHLHKIERFVVVKGEAEIGFRRLLHDDVVTFKVSGDDPTIIDMPTLWVHNLRNIGDSELVTFFWADQLLDRENPDQYPELVSAQGA